MIVFVHMLKAGGTTLRTALEQTFGPGLLWDYDDIPMSNRPEHASQRARRQADLAIHGVPNTTRIVFGHFVMSKYRGLRPDLSFATMLRDPAERIVSHYFHYLRNRGGPRNEILPEGIGLLEFSSLPNYRDMYRYLLGDVQVSELAYVGLTEELDASLELFHRVFELPRPPEAPVSAGHLNRAGEYQNAGTYLRDTGLLDAIRESQAVNYAIYDEARARFADLCARHGVERGARPQG